MNDTELFALSVLVQSLHAQVREEKKMGWDKAICLDGGPTTGQLLEEKREQLAAELNHRTAPAAKPPVEAPKPKSRTMFIKNGKERVEFNDCEGRDSSIQSGTTGGHPFLWLGCEKTMNGSVNSRMLLTQDDVRRLLPFLNAFADHGTIDPKG